MNIAIATNWATGWATNWSDSQLLRAGSSVGRKVGAGLQAVQYAQMIAVMNRLPDDYLEKAGLRRGDIPEHARRAIYGEEIAGPR
jgi:uncharacterized protein YjiS (DUF1127 family)